MYSNNLVATIKVGGKILRENKNTVAVPFGAEYSVFVKNLSSVRALVKISVDGTDATDSTWLIVPSNGSVELERFIRNGNWNKGNRFKFIERTSAIEDHRGIGAEDGLVRVEYKFEEPFNNSQWLQGGQWNSSDFCGTTNTNIFRSSSPFVGSIQNHLSKNLSYTSSNSSNVCRNVTTHDAFYESSMDDIDSIGTPSVPAGITVAGSESNQKFVQGEWFPTENTSHVLVLKLVGAVKGKVVKQAVTVQYKPTCTSCGRINKATHKFCGSCGTALQLF